MRQLRNQIQSLVSLDYFQQRVAAGWKLKAMEWEREDEEEMAQAAEAANDAPLPYGLAVVPETARVEEQPAEVEVLRTILELTVAKKGVGQIAAELNRRGYATRGGTMWTPTAVFDLLPRLVETAPDILKGEDWLARRSA